VSSWPCGQAAGSEDWLIGRVCSKVSPQARHRYSYRGTCSSYAAGRRGHYPPGARGRGAPAELAAAAARPLLTGGYRCQVKVAGWCGFPPAVKRTGRAPV
jgi:hypothetical protein